MRPSAPLRNASLPAAAPPPFGAETKKSAPPSTPPSAGPGRSAGSSPAAVESARPHGSASHTSRLGRERRGNPQSTRQWRPRAGERRDSGADRSARSGSPRRREHAVHARDRRPVVRFFSSPRCARRRSARSPPAGSTDSDPSRSRRRRRPVVDGLPAVRRIHPHAAAWNSGPAWPRTATSVVTNLPVVVPAPTCDKAAAADGAGGILLSDRRRRTASIVHRDDAVACNGFMVGEHGVDARPGAGTMTDPQSGSTAVVIRMSQWAEIALASGGEGAEDEIARARWPEDGRRPDEPGS